MRGAFEAYKSIKKGVEKDEKIIKFWSYKSHSIIVFGLCSLHYFFALTLNSQWYLKHLYFQLLEIDLVLFKENRYRVRSTLSLHGGDSGSNSGWVEMFDSVNNVTSKTAEIMEFE